MNTHGNVVFNCQAYREWVPLGAATWCSASHPFSTSPGLSRASPRRCCSAPRSCSSTGSSLGRAGGHPRRAATFTVGSITVFIALMNAPDAGRDALSSLTKVWSGGAPSPPRSVEAFRRNTGGVHIHNVYGLTETTSPSHMVPCGARAPVDEQSGALSVGVPVFTRGSASWTTTTRSWPWRGGRDRHQGPQVVAGYWNKPRRPTGSLPGGWLHTGDIGVMDAGWLVLPRRPEEGHDQRRRLQGVAARGRGRALLAQGRARGRSGRRARRLPRRERQGLRQPAPRPERHRRGIAFCRAQMAAYKYPRQVEFLDELPKTTSGKLLRRELRARN